MSDERRDAELEVARAADLLGVHRPDIDRDVRVLARVLNHAESSSSPDRAGLGHGRSRRVLLVTAAAAVVIVAVLIGAQIWTSPSAAAAPPMLRYPNADLAHLRDAELPAAEERLTQLAAVAAHSAVGGTGDVAYIRAVGWYPSYDPDVARIIPKETSSWFAPDGSAQTDEVAGTELQADGTISPYPSGIPTHSSDVSPPGSIPSPAAIVTGDPGTLIERIRPDRCAQPPAEVDSCLLEELSFIAGSSILSPEQTEVLWSALSREPGVRLLGDTTDRLGRPVVAITAAASAMNEEHYQVVLLIDSATGRYVGNEFISYDSAQLEVTEPTVISFTTLREEAFVERLGELPDQ